MTTQSLSRAWRFSEGLEYGMVGVNTGVISNEVTAISTLSSSDQ